MNIENIPTPETDSAWSDPQRTRDGTGFRSDVRGIDIAYSVSEKSKDLERRLSVAREALKLVKEMHEHEATGDPDRQSTDEGRARHAQAIIEALTITAPKP